MYSICICTFPLSLDCFIHSELNADISFHSGRSVLTNIGFPHLHMFTFTYTCIVYTALNLHACAFIHIHTRTIYMYMYTTGGLRCTSTMEKELMGRADLAQPAKLVMPSGVTLLWTEGEREYHVNMDKSNERT